MTDNYLNVIDFDGSNKTIEVLKYFELKKNGKDYIIYKDRNDVKNYLVYAAEVIENDDEIILKEIDNEEIKKTLEDIMEKIKDEWNCWKGCQKFKI